MSVLYAVSVYWRKDRKMQADREAAEHLVQNILDMEKCCYLPGRK